jgi:hypothetical protein
MSDEVVSGDWGGMAPVSVPVVRLQGAELELVHTGHRLSGVIRFLGTFANPQFHVGLPLYLRLER